MIHPGQSLYLPGVPLSVLHPYILALLTKLLKSLVGVSTVRVRQKSGGMRFVGNGRPHGGILTDPPVDGGCPGLTRRVSSPRDLSATQLKASLEVGFPAHH